MGTSSSMDTFTATGSRQAKVRSRISGQEDTSKRLKTVQKKPFWQIAPDGKTIERAYQGPEPIDIRSAPE